MQKLPRIVLIGCQNVAPQSVYALLNGNVPVEVVLVSEFSGSLMDEVQKLVYERPLASKSRARVGSAADLNDSEICILASTKQPKAKETEESFVLRNIMAVSRKGKLLLKHDFAGILVVTITPAIEKMTAAAMEASGLPASKVIGLGSNASPNNQSALNVTGSLATWCSAEGCSPEFIDSCHPDCPYFEGILESFHNTQNVHFVSGMATCVMRICEAILSDEKAVLPVVAILDTEHGATPRFANIPCVIGKRGIEMSLAKTEIANQTKRNRFTDHKKLAVNSTSA
jgi:L-lactate dehydrogenase